MDEYTPDDEQVEAEWTAFMSTPDPDNYWDAMSEEEAKARWSRWLAAHDARIRRDAVHAALLGAEQHIRANMDEPYGDRAANRVADYARTYRPEESP